MEQKTCPISSFLYKDEGSGSFTAYGSVFGVIDLQNECTLPGCFKDSLADWITKGHVHLNHNRDISIATVDWADEDNYGLRFQASFLSNRDGQNARGMMADRLKRGKETGLSIGYNPITKRKRKDGVTELAKVRLHEVSVLTVRPANESTRILQVKGTLEEEFEAIRRERRIEQAQAARRKALMMRLYEEHRLRKAGLRI